MSVEVDNQPRRQPADDSDAVDRLRLQMVLHRSTDPKLFEALAGLNRYERSDRVRTLLSIGLMAQRIGEVYGTAAATQGIGEGTKVSRTSKARSQGHGREGRRADAAVDRQEAFPEFSVPQW